MHIKSSPTDTIFNRFDKSIDTISVPSKDALLRNIKPTPKPKRIPPKIVTSNKSSVICPHFVTIFVAIASIEIANIVFITIFAIGL